jgi:hypothetical protein
MYFISLIISSHSCGTIFRRVDGVDDRETDPTALNRQRERSGFRDEETDRHGRPKKRKREENENLSNVQKFRRIRLVQRMEVSRGSAQPTKTKYNTLTADHSLIAHDMGMNAFNAFGERQRNENRTLNEHNTNGVKGARNRLDTSAEGLIDGFAQWLTTDSAGPSFATTSDFGLPYAMDNGFEEWLFNPSSPLNAVDLPSYSLLRIHT